MKLATGAVAEILANQFERSGRIGYSMLRLQRNDLGDFVFGDG